MIRSPLTYHSPRGLEEAAALLAEHGDGASVLGGGTVLVPAMVRGERNHGHLVDLRKLALDSVRVSDGWAVLGARTTYAQVLAHGELTGSAALLRRAAAGITGGAQLRNQGTVAGSAAYANPASDMPGCLVAAGAIVALYSSGATREVAAKEFFLGAFDTAIRAGELVTAIRVPLRPARMGYYKLKLSEGSWPIATAAAVADRDTGAVLVTLGAVAERPITFEVSELVTEQGRPRDQREFDAFVRSRIEHPWADALATGDYRREVAAVVARRALRQLEQQTTEGDPR
jgi:CO/xanthine dehydrogenase FAD-binding subunit